jgi:hypothetical protein
VSFLRFFLEYAYAAYHPLDLDAAFAPVLAALGRQDSLTVGDFFTLLRPVIEDVARDGHMWMYVPGAPPADAARWASSGAHRWDAYVFADRATAASIDPSSCALPTDSKVAKDQWFVQVGGNVQQAVVLSREPLTSLKCGSQSLAVTKILPSGHVPSRAFTERALDATTYYIRQPAFSNIDGDMRAKFTASADNARAHENVVLDLRGNPGGDPSYFLAWAEELGLRGTVHYSTLVHTDSFAADVLGNNALESYLHTAGVGADAKEQLTSELAPLKDSVHRALAAKSFRRFVAADANAPDTEYTLVPVGSAYTGKVRVLVDASCASACEWAAHIAEQLDNVSVMSETNTAGVVAGADPAPLPLPNSTIVFSMPTGMGARPGSHVVEGLGVTPSIWLDAQAMETLFP